MSLESAYSTIEKLVNDFKNNERHYLATDYSESQARLDFIDKLFIALGWDVNHEHQKNPYEQEVKVERRVKDKEAQKRADYAFFLEPNYRDPKFYVEAKKPSRSLDNPYDYFQAIRYGWNAQTPLVVLTDFEEFHILDSRFKPNIKYTKERKVLSFHYSDYLDEEKFAKLYYLFSREAVGNGSIEKFAETMPKPRGKAVQKGLFPGSYQSIDESFLTELDEIRNTLARSFKKKNPALTSEELTEATQRTIDRLVFIRFLEDMLIEGEHHISNYGDKGTAWGDFIADCRSLNAKYNGIVFKEHFIDRLPPSKGGSVIAPDDKDFADICEELSHVNSPYNFNSIPIHILGSIYERFLGKVVHATDKRVTIEEKPEVRKAGGVYYTPQYIVQYIVNNTVGKLIEGKTPTEISKLRFADISCGSGSFLITVYDTLLRYYSRYYQEHAKEAKTDGCIFSNGLWVLSLKQKRHILLNNVYGVDIDHQAVEVTQLSLYLKLLEDETLATANEMQALFKEKILPDLSKNIICGNSLIGTEIREGNMFPDEEEKKINAMNFDDTFSEIANEGGFDVIVGNPPYGAELNDTTRQYLIQHYKFQNYQLDTTFLFVEKAIRLLKNKADLGYIIPNTWLQNLLQKNLRNFIFRNLVINEIVHYTNKVFKQATVDTEIILLKNVQPHNNNIKITIANAENTTSTHLIEQEKWIINDGKPVNILEKPEYNLIANKFLAFEVLDNVSKITQGCKPFQVGKGKPKQTKQILDEKPFVANVKKDETFRPLLRGSNINRYTINWNEDYWISFGDWLAEPRYSANYDLEKIVIRQTGDSLIATLDLDKFIVRDNLYTIIIASKFINLKYILALINSKLLNWYYQNIINPERGEALAQVKRGHIAQLPIKDIDSTNVIEKKKHNEIVMYVEELLHTKSRIKESITDKDRTFYYNKCNTLDRQIDRLVYELYGLTEEEIKIVEEN